MFEIYDIHRSPMHAQFKFKEKLVNQHSLSRLLVVTAKTLILIQCLELYEYYQTQ